MYFDQSTGLPDFRNLGAALADDAADDLVGHGHLVGLVGGGHLGPAAAPRQGCQRYENGKIYYYSHALLRDE